MATLPHLLAQHFRAAYFGGNWTERDLRGLLTNVSWQQAVTPAQDLNTIAVLVFHIHYYTKAQLRVLEGGALAASDKLAFTPPPITSTADWQTLLQNTWAEAERFIERLEALDPAQLHAPFCDPKYGTYYANLQGNLEHLYYHLGQIALLKKLLKIEVSAG